MSGLWVACFSIQRDTLGVVGRMQMAVEVGEESWHWVMHGLDVHVCHRGRWHMRSRRCRST